MSSIESTAHTEAPQNDDDGAWWPELEARLSSLALFANPAGLAARALRILIEREPQWFLVDEAGDFYRHVSTGGVIDWDALCTAAASWPADRRFLALTAAAMVRGENQAAAAQPRDGVLDERRYATWQAMRAAYNDEEAGAEAYLNVVTNSPLAGLGRGFTRYAAKLHAEGVEVPEPVMVAAAVLQDPDADSEAIGRAAHRVTSYSNGLKSPKAP
jgi:hypothetical protein